MAAQPYDWSQYFTLADELAKRADEASHRTAISRAYYYVYHLARARAEANRFSPNRGESTHLQLWRLFTANPDAQCQRLGHLGMRLKEKRERADYNDAYPRVADDVPVILADARTFAESLQALPTRHPDPRSIRA